MKRRIVQFLQKYLLNPPIMLSFAMGVARPGYALLETVGRRTGKPRCTPVGDGRVGSQFWIVAEHGRQSGYVRNIEANLRVRLKLRNGLGGRWHTGIAYVLADDDPRERQRWLTTQVRGARRNAAAVRFFGTELLTVRIDARALPRPDELVVARVKDPVEPIEGPLLLAQCSVDIGYLGGSSAN